MKPLTHSTATSSLYIGLMSGTSMDSIDAALMDFAAPAPRLLYACKKPIETTTRAKLLQLCQQPQQPLLGEMDVQLGEEFAAVAKLLLDKSGMGPEGIGAIGSHGQTIYHQPPVKNKNGFSLQIGDPNIIALRSGITTVADFRRKDMAAGGQGAPLVPAFHHALFQSVSHHRAIINIGGIANITILPASGKVRGFDTGPGNVLLDGWIVRHQGKPYDESGNWAASGSVNHKLLDKLLEENYFLLPPPKSTGRELFNNNWLDTQLAQGFHTTAPNDVQATLTALTASTIAQAIAQHAPQTDEIFVCGGGVHNRLLMDMLKTSTRLPVESTSGLGLDPDWVEAAAFAWLAKQTLEGKPGNLPEVTGAKAAVVLGGIYR